MIYCRSSESIIASFCRSFNATHALFEAEGSSDSFTLANNILQSGQKEIVNVAPLPEEQVFEDFKTEIKYTVDYGDVIHGIHAYDLRNGPLKMNMASKKGALQLCILTLNESPTPEKFLLKYNGITQEFWVSWKEWGWAPVSLLKQYEKGEKVEFEILPANSNSNLKIAKAYLRYQDIEFTD
jgi:hypothetical protein